MSEENVKHLSAGPSTKGRVYFDLWLNRKQETGDYHAIEHYQQGCGHKITDWDKFLAFTAANKGKTQAQMAKLWGHGVTQKNISDALRKIGFTRKKRPMAIVNEMKHNEKYS